MSQQDDLDKLLREIDAMNAGGSTASGGPASPGAVTPRPSAQPDVRAGGATSARGKKGTAGGRVAWTGVGAVGAGAVGGVLGTVLTFLPAVSTLSTAVGAALGGALVAFVSGPPRWFDQE